MEKIGDTIQNKYTFEVRDLRNGQWFYIHKWIIKEYGSIIKPNGIAVYNVLSGYSNYKTQKSWPSLKAISDLIGVSRDTAKRSIKQLIDLKLVKRERIGRYHYIYYLLKNPKIRGGSDALSENKRGQMKFKRGQNKASEGAARGTINNKEQELYNNKEKNLKNNKNTKYKPLIETKRKALDQMKEHFEKNKTFEKDEKRE